MDKRVLLNRGLNWILGNGNKINFWLDNWVNDSPLINKVIPDKVEYINKEVKVSNFLDMTKKLET